MPLRLEIGPRDVATGTVMLARRTGRKKESLPDGRHGAEVDGPWSAMQASCSRRARGAKPNSIRGATKQEFIA